ncbi:pyridoxamine 5'-phosphate oxidase family protein [Ramlibacter sp.]|uniref:pyridoxamine 5'-phosphate oxidase family protein n=1 Tax=Ramlibacter sp. TaxID=1917967 RepID=UPI00184546D6|nr:pyridoxamine 5'-phosphate oxidase family protein [Ramlibacter sp.]MBA2675256.1 pyridoxamine 5'-phosphate oxidase family protein [Ramlibacter sp.]
MTTTQPSAHTITTPQQLQALFDAPGEASLRKEVDFVHPLYRAMIEASPFAVLATAGPEGLDASPRGDPGGCVVVQDERTLLLPERRGNNRVDSLRNLLADPRMALLFLIPGVGETLRVNGRARISVEPALLERCAMRGALPKCVLVIDVERVFFQCARAIQRSRLWQPLPAETLAKVPTAGQVLEALTERAIDGDGYDRALPERQRSTLY